MPYLYVVRYPSLCVRQAGYISQTKDKQALCDTFISDIRSLMKSVCGMKISLSRTPHNATPQLNPVPTNHAVSTPQLNPVPTNHAVSTPHLNPVLTCHPVSSNHVKSLLGHYITALGCYPKCL